MSGYPLIPWIGVMAAGYAFGSFLLLEAARRRRRLILLGVSMVALFVVLRALNVYGDPNPWKGQRDGLFTVLSFLNCLKYPPSLLFLLMTLGPAIALLGLLDRPLGAWSRPLLVLGRVPLFFYLLQWPLIHGGAIALARAIGQPYQWLMSDGPFQPPPGYGYPLWSTYVMWAVVLLVLFPACAWFAGVKKRYWWGWLSYL
jgi:uncharacterized membrane protein